MAGNMETRETKSEIEAMEEFANQMWERYFKPRASEELLGHSLDGYKAQVKTNNGDGTLTVTRPFDCCEQRLKCPPALADSAEPGDQVLVVNLGDASNAFILCGTDLTGFGGGVGIGVDSLGDIAQLTVDRLSTSDRVKKYFLQDTTPDYFLRIQDGTLQFVNGTVTSMMPVQEQDRYGRSLYWTRQPTGHMPDGSPIDGDGNRVYSGTAVTNWPVYTYTYTETVVGSVSKSGTDLVFQYTDSGGNEVSVILGTDGFVEINRLRRATVMDFSNFDNGYFSETLEGNVVCSYSVDFDSQGRPIKIYDEEHECQVVW